MSDDGVLPPKSNQQPPVYRVDRVAQTLPEQKQAAQQVDMDNYDYRQSAGVYPINTQYQRQFDDHATIALRDDNDHHHRRRDNARYNNAKTTFHPFSYPAATRYRTTTDEWEEREEWKESIVDTTHYGKIF